MSSAKLNALRSLSNLMKFISFSLSLTMLSWFSYAEQAAPEVGKHVAANLDVASVIMSLLLVLVLIIAIAFVLKRFNPQGASLSGMKIVSSLHLGTKEKLVVVDVDGKQLLLGVTAHQVSFIQTLEKPMEVGQPLTMDLSQNIVKLLKKNDK